MPSVAVQKCLQNTPSPRNMILLQRWSTMSKNTSEEKVSTFLKIKKYCWDIPIKTVTWCKYEGLDIAAMGQGGKFMHHCRD